MRHKEKLREAERIEQEHQRWKAEQILTLTDEDRSRVTAMGIDLPQLWETLGNAERKAILRLVIDQVVLDQRRAKGMVWLHHLANWSDERALDQAQDGVLCAGSAC